MLLLCPLLFIFTLSSQASASDHKHVTVASEQAFTSTECSRQHMVEAVKASSHCQPMVKVVKLDIPGNGSYTQMTPQFIEVKRCGGGCHTTSHSCVSTQKQIREVAVLLSSCGLTAGLCSKSCATLAIEEDTACRCDCLQEQKLCHNARHIYNGQECRCECREEEGYTLCRDQGRLWDNEECVCRCPVEMIKPCSSGLTFDMSTCSCITEDASETANLVTDERVERSDTNYRNEIKFGEMIVMVALAGVATVFFIIIISLLHSIKTLRRSIRSIRKGKSSENICSEQSLLQTQNE